MDRHGPPGGSLTPFAGVSYSSYRKLGRARRSHSRANSRQAYELIRDGHRLIGRLKPAFFSAFHLAPVKEESWNQRLALR
jgi:hypothetical protein